ncbi:MAG TPA: hypothetical protein VK766_04375 [Cytophagaceae bacterium]|jgi:hypothetical protein|nr:hypothetical protein [Cytophagaceae bacterium]
MKQPSNFGLVICAGFISMYRSSRTNFCLLLAIAVYTSACSISKHTSSRLPVDSRYCEPSVKFEYDTLAHPLWDIKEVVDSALLERYSYHSLHVANATGVLMELKDLCQHEQLMLDNYSSRSQTIYTAKRQHIMNRLMLVSTEVASISAELDCEGERASQIADFLTEKENRKVKSFTVMSITVGAVTGIITTLLQTRNGSLTGQEIIGIGGGIMSAGLGLSTLFSNRSIVYHHPRNLLTDIWNDGEKTSVYPPAVWYMLKEDPFSGTGKNSVCQHIRERWQQYGMLGDTTSKDFGQVQALFFGEGGRYSQDQLRIRASMLNQVQAEVRLMTQDLHILMLELSK